MVSIDIDIDDILSSCDSYDRLEIIKALIEDGYLPKELVRQGGEYVINPGRYSNNFNSDFNESLDKLYNRGWQLTIEEENTIKNIANKFL